MASPPSERASRPHPTAALFDRVAEAYDRARRQLLPCFDDFYGAAVEVVRRRVARTRVDAEPVEVLDLGAGTGLLSSLLSARLATEGTAEVTFVAFDGAPAMLAEAERRFAGKPHALEAIVGDLNRPSQLPTGPFDAVVSALAIHHLDDRAKVALYEAAAERLRPGGVFVNADQVAGPTPALDAEYHDVWLEEIRARGAREEDIAAALVRMEADRCAPVEPQLEWLRSVGLVEVHCVAKWWRFAVLSGVRPG